MSLRPNQVSVIVPVKAYNDFCRESLAAVARLYPDQEILFSPDQETQVPIAGVTVVPSGPVGPGAKRDLCAARAKGEILAFLDDDAFPAPGWLEAAIEIFADPRVGAVGGPAVTPADDSVERWASGLVYESWMVGGPYAFRYRPLPRRDCDDFPTCNLLVRKSVFDAIGGFDTRYWPGEDTVACLKITHEQGKRLVYDPKVLVYHHRREMLAGHLRQLNRYARHRGFFVKRFPKTSLRASYFAPSVLLIWVLLGWVAAPEFWADSLAIYALLAALEAARMQSRAPRERRGFWLWVLVTCGLVATHLSYGFNFMLGLFSSKMQEERVAMTGKQA